VIWTGYCQLKIGDLVLKSSLSPSHLLWFQQARAGPYIVLDSSEIGKDPAV
jgi:hypothetical protein